MLLDRISPIIQMRRTPFGHDALDMFPSEAITKFCPKNKNLTATWSGNLRTTVLSKFSSQTYPFNHKNIFFLRLLHNQVTAYKYVLHYQMREIRHLLLPSLLHIV
jgi:hypothetical protein